MNGEKRKKYKPRPCALSDEALAEIAKFLSKRFYRYQEIQKHVSKEYGFNVDALSVLSYLETRGYLIATEEVPGCKTMVLYRVMTKEVYEKIAEEHRENAYRRCLEKTS